MRFLLGLFLVGCVSPGPLKKDHDELGRILSNISTEMALECAPQEYAKAQSEHVFAGLGLEQADTRRAREHLDQGLLYARSAHVLAKECVPKDTDEDGIVDKEDACPEEPEDFDGVEDEDGCPEGTGMPMATVFWIRMMIAPMSRKTPMALKTKTAAPIPTTMAMALQTAMTNASIVA